MLLSLLLAPALAGSIDDTLAQLIPELEAHTGRSFLHPPIVESVRREELRARLTTEQRRLNQLLGTPEQDVNIADHIRPFVLHAAGVYTYGDRRIYMVEEALEEILESSGAPSRMQEPVLRCVLAHELVHVLQHQYQPMSDTTGPEQLLLARAMREGHAELLSEPFCAQDQAGALINAHRGLDVLASQRHGDDEQVALLYGYSTRYLRAVQEQYDTETSWWLLSQPPPTREAMVEVGRAGLLQGWQDPQALIAPLSLENGPEWRVEAGPTSPLHVLRPLQPPAGWPLEAATPRAGLLYNTTRRLATQQSVTVVAVAMQDPAQARRALELRRTALAQSKTGQELILMGSVSQYKPNYKVRSLRRPSAQRPPDDSLSLHLRSPTGDYHEQWVARDGLVMMAAARHPDVNGRQLTQLLMDLLDQEWPTQAPATAPPTLTLSPPDPLPPITPSWEYPLLNMLVQQDAQDWEGCIESVRQIAPTAPVDALPTLADAGYQCALAANEVQITDRMLEALGGGQHVAPLLRLTHATQRYLAGRPRAALSLVRDLADQDLDLPPEQANQLEDLWLVLLADGGQLSEALRRVRRGEGQPEAQLYVAMRLLDERREPEAMPLLRAVCPQVSGDEAQACQDAMDYLTPGR